MASITLDVRSYHLEGIEPFDAIMTAVRDVGPGERFTLINTFEPLPLFNVLGRMGFTHTATQVGPEEWRIDFDRA
jgi:uncharacterized protein (DUF2249 family)